MPIKKNVTNNNSFTMRDNLIFNCLYVICDSMTVELVRRNKIYEDTIYIFKIFFEHNLIDSEKKKLSQHVKNR